MAVMHRRISTRYAVKIIKLGGIAQSVTFLIMDGRLTADPGLAMLILARSNTFVEIDHEIISRIILSHSADLFKKDFCQLQAKYVNSTS